MVGSLARTGLADQVEAACLTHGGVEAVCVSESYMTAALSRSAPARVRPAGGPSVLTRIRRASAIGLRHSRPFMKPADRVFLDSGGCRASRGTVTRSVRGILAPLGAGFSKRSIDERSRLPRTLASVRSEKRPRGLRAGHQALADASDACRGCAPSVSPRSGHFPNERLVASPTRTS